MMRYGVLIACLILLSWSHDIYSFSLYSINLPESVVVEFWQRNSRLIQHCASEAGVERYHVLLKLYRYDPASKKLEESDKEHSSRFVVRCCVSPYLEDRVWQSRNPDRPDIIRFLDDIKSCEQPCEILPDEVVTAFLKKRGSMLDRLQATQSGVDQQMRIIRGVCLDKQIKEYKIYSELLQNSNSRFCFSDTFNMGENSGASIH